MTAAEINSVIDNLCQIFGVTVDRLVPEMAKMYIARLATQAGICILLIVAFCVAINALLKKHGSAEKLCERLDCDPFLFVAVLVGCVAAIISLIVLFLVVPDLAQWIASPLGSTVEVIARAIRG
jgi:uncharacterized membrane protein YidH (DUF202 family)